MHPSHQNGTTERPAPTDRLTEWLLTHCPMSTLAILTMLVMGATLGVYWPWPVLVTAVTFDLVLNLIRRRRSKRSAHPAAHSRAPAG
jgi:hypothetical protein